MRVGLTLLEMVVVLAILATLATVATIAVQPSVDATRYEATRRTLEDLRSAVHARRSGDAVIGFSADLGRLAQPDASQANHQRWRELWDASRWKPFGPRTGSVIAGTAAASEVTVYAGWRGPYLTLPVGQDGITDGWSNALSDLGTTSFSVVLGSPGVGRDATYTSTITAAAVTLPTITLTISSTNGTVLAASWCSPNPAFEPATSTVTDQILATDLGAVPANSASFTFPPFTTSPGLHVVVVQTSVQAAAVQRSVMIEPLGGSYLIGVP
jgi:prepilin-type N-terminal cleavage/methylation domain-containing protein